MEPCECIECGGQHCRATDACEYTCEHGDQMKTTNELGRFLHDNRLSMRVGLTREGFHVDLLFRGAVTGSGMAATFPDAVDEALADLARQKGKELRS